MYEKTTYNTMTERTTTQPEAKYVLAKNLKRFRMENNISQEEIADKIGFDYKQGYFYVKPEKLKI